MVNTIIYVVVFAVIAIALAIVGRNYANIKEKKNHNADPGKIAGDLTVEESKKVQDEMWGLSKTIREGADKFMLTEFKTIIAVVIVVALGFSLFIEATAGITFIMGATMSSLACIIGMKGALYANYRVARRAFRNRSIGRTVRTALKGGSISGLSVEAFGLLGVIAILIIWGGVNPTDNTGRGLILSVACNPTALRFTAYSLGCSVVAMFNRVAGGNFTKAADISADIVGKIRNDLDEDNPFLPNTISDFIGDNVNDTAGNCSDLLESFVATIVASELLGSTIFGYIGGDNVFYNSIIMFPIILPTIGLFASIIGLLYALNNKAYDAADLKLDPSKSLNTATYISAGVTIIGSAIAAKWLFDGISVAEFQLGWISPWFAAVFGIISGVLVGTITEYYTSLEKSPVKAIAEIATEGEAFVFTKGDAVGSRSVLLPCLVIGISILLSWKIAGVYGIAIAALGMLSFVATTVSVDAFGPIADNAGGIVEGVFVLLGKEEGDDGGVMYKLGEQIRAITDTLDATGNTTAAIGKGFAIGSAAFATVSLIFSYVGSYSTGEPMLNVASPLVIVGCLVGGALVEYFSALLTDNTIESAHLMADAGAAQLTDEVLAGKKRPDYAALVELATNQALKKMLFPSVLALIVPVISGFLFGVEFVGGMLIGATVVAVPKAMFMGNSGGAWDNAKKYIEAGKLIIDGKLIGKNTAAHKAAVAGDTAGDTRKDVVGVALDIFIKTMSTVACTLAMLFVHYHLF